MKKIDLYIIRKFLGTFVLSISLIIVVVIAFDLSEKVDDFLDRKAPLGAILFQYYFNFIPYFINLFSPLFVFISVVFFTSRMASNTELIAIHNAGVSFTRILRPYIYGALVLALLSFFLQNFIIPSANKNRLDFESQYVKSKKSLRPRHIHLQTGPGELMYMESYNPETYEGFRFSLEKIDYINGLQRKLTADQAKFDTIKGTWVLTNCFDRYINGKDEKLIHRMKIDTLLNLSPADFDKNINNEELMNYFELREYIKKQKLKGSEDVAWLDVKRHRRIAFPFSTIILTLIGFALSNRKSRGGTGLHIGIGLAISFAFIMMMQISETFATKGNFPPWLAVWTPNFLFAIIAFYLLKRAPK